jgi:hypothetical protein
MVGASPWQKAPVSTSRQLLLERIQAQHHPVSVPIVLLLGRDP